MRILRELPLIWFLAGCAVGWLCIVVLRHSSNPRRGVLLRRVAMGAGILVVGIYIALNLVSLRSYMLEMDEADILSVSAASLHGQQMYHAVNSPDYSYAMLYGPATFLIYRAGLVIGDGRFWVLRAFLVLANLLLCFVLYSIFRKFLRRSTSAMLTSIPLYALLPQIPDSLGLRPDAWIVLTMALAVRSTLMESEMAAAILTGFWCGTAIDLKATVAPSFVLLLLMLYRRWGAKAATIAALVATVTALAPFALSTVSIVNYWMWLIVAKHEGLSHKLLIQSLAFSVLLVLPLVIFRLCGVSPWPNKTLKQSLPESLLFACCLLAAIGIASKDGAGIWHFWQLLPILAVYVAIAAGRSEIANPEQLTYALFIVMLGGTAIAAGYVSRDLHRVRPPQRALVAAQLREGNREIEGYLNLYRGHTLQLGYGSVPDTTIETLRYLPVLRNQPYSLDGSARIESLFQPFPVNVLERMNHCTNDVWLIPHGERPFWQWHFPEIVGNTFVQHYVIQQRGELLDAWVCKAS